MPYHEPDPGDPNVLVGIEMPINVDTTEDMAYVFAEEFARIGFDKERIMGIFARPFYVGAHRAFLELGACRTEQIVDECLEIWSQSKRKIS